MASVSATFIADFTSFQQAIAKTNVSLELFESRSDKVGKALGRMGDEFSGRKVVQEATTAAAAIEKIGGASKLTASEQARVNAVVTEALAKYRALGQEAPKALRDLAEATRKIEPPMAAANKATSVLTSAFGQFTAANLAASAIQNVIGKVNDFVQQGTRLPGLQASFERLASGVGESSQTMLAELQTSTRGMVANVDLMQSANKALLLGLPVTTESMGELAKTATVLGKAMGQDATKSLDDLITALGRSSPMILDNLGLSVKLGEANEEYARKLGKTVEQMTDAERKMAFYEAAMEAARKKTQELGEQTLTLGERFQQAWTEVANFTTQSASDINVVLGKATQSWGDFFAFLKDAAKFTPWEEMARNLRPPKEAILPFIDPGALARPSAIYQEEMAEVDKAHQRSKEAAKAHAEAIRQLSEQLGGQGAIKAARDMAEALNRLPPVYTLMREKQDEINKVMTTAIAAYRAQGREAPDAIRKIAAATFDLSKLTPPIESGLSGGFANIGRQAKASIPDIIQLYATIQEGIPKIVDGLVNITNSFPGKIDVSKIELPAIPPTKLQALFGSSAELGAALGNSIMAAIQGGGNIFEAAGSLLGSKLTASLANYLTRTKDAMGNAIAPILSGWIGGAVNAIIPGIGALLGPLMSKIQDVFGGPSQEELAGRSIVESFEKQLQGSLSASTKLAAGNESWKLTTIAVRDAYIAAGKTVAEAEAAVAKLWVSSRGGAKAAELAILEIQAVLEKVAGKQTEQAEAVKEQQATIEKATAGIKNKIGELDSEYNSLFESIRNEAPEEVMGIVEAQTRARMDAIKNERATAENELERITSQMEKSFEAVAASAEQAAKRIADAFGGIRTPGMEQLHAPPVVNPDVAARSMAANTATAAQQDITVMLDGRVLTSAVFRGLPDVARLYVR